MLKVNPQAIVHLSKLNRAVLQATGKKYGISEEKGLISLLQFVKDNPNEAYQDIFQKFLGALSEEEAYSFGLAYDDTDNLIPAGTDSAAEHTYYRGSKVQKDSQATKAKKKKLNYRGIRQ